VLLAQRRLLREHECGAGCAATARSRLQRPLAAAYDRASMCKEGVSSGDGGGRGAHPDRAPAVAGLRRPRPVA